MRRPHSLGRAPLGLGLVCHASSCRRPSFSPVLNSSTCGVPRLFNPANGAGDDRSAAIEAAQHLQNVRVAQRVASTRHDAPQQSVGPLHKPQCGSMCRWKPETIVPARGSFDGAQRELVRFEGFSILLMIRRHLTPNLMMKIKHERTT